MNIKNAVSKNENDTLIDVEIEHPTYGWIPYTFNTVDEDTSFYAEIRVWLETATVQPYTEPTKTEEQIRAEKVAEAQALLDSTQFKFGDDYDQKDTPEWLALKVKRQEAREFIRINDVPNP